MNAEELKSKYESLYKYMANSNEPDNMKAFGKVMTEMFMWYADNKPDAASEWLDKLSAIMWKNYLTPKEADVIVAAMKPEAPWNREQWRGAMEKHGFVMDEEPYYNRCALYATMNMIMSDSSATLSKYVNGEEMFKVVHDLAVDKLKDADGKFSIRAYFGL
jgi:hypothetical protein